MGVIRDLADPLVGVEPAELFGVVRALDRLLERLCRNGRVFALHVVAERLFFGVIPRLLAFVNDYAVFRLHLSKVLNQACREQFYRVNCVLRILPPGEECCGQVFLTRRSDGRVMHRRATGRQGWPAFRTVRVIGSQVLNAIGYCYKS